MILTFLCSYSLDLPGTGDSGMVTSALPILSQSPSLPHNAFWRQRKRALAWREQPLLAPLRGLSSPAVNVLCFLLNTAVLGLAEAQVPLPDEGRYPRWRREGSSSKGKNQEW